MSRPVLGRILVEDAEILQLYLRICYNAVDLVDDFRRVVGAFLRSEAAEYGLRGGFGTTSMPGTMIFEPPTDLCSSLSSN